MGVAAGDRAPAVPRNTAGWPFLPPRKAPRDLDCGRCVPYHPRMGRSGPLLALAALLAAACTAWPGSGPPAAFQDLPWQDRPADLEVMRARAAAEQGETRLGLSVVETVLQREPCHVDALRLRQDLLRERGRRGLLAAEVAPGVAGTADALHTYLAGRVAADAEVRLRCFRRAAELAGDSLWPWLGLAHTLARADEPAALELYERLHGASGGHPLVDVAYATELRQADRCEEALVVARHLAADPRVAGLGWLGVAQAQLALGREPDAWLALLEAVRLRPGDPSVQALVHNWLQAGASSDRAAQVLDVLREDPARFVAFGRGDGAAVLADLLLRSLQAPAAVALLQQVPGVARRPALRRLLRRAELAVGDVAAFLRILREDIPRELVGAEGNRLRARWLQLLDGPWNEGDPLATRERAEGLLRALAQVGLLSELEQIAPLVLQRWPDAAAAVTARDEARRELAFEASLRRILYQGYRENTPQGLRAVLEQLRQASARIFGRDVVGEPTIYHVPLVGDLVDPFHGPLAEHFASHNRHVVLGRRAGGTAEGMVLARLSVADLPDRPELPLPMRCVEVIGFDRDVRAVSGVVGGDLAGVALLDHFLVDHDAVRDWARAIADRRRVIAEDGGAALRDPLPTAPGLDPLDVAWRLAAVSPVQDRDLESAVLDMIRVHERQHLVDASCYLPIEQNLGRGLSLLLRFGVSAARIQAEMERRAELAALAWSAHPELVLAHVADFAGEPEVESPHHQGFSALAKQFVEALGRLGVPAEAAAPCRWHELPQDIVRNAARSLLTDGK